MKYLPTFLISLIIAVVMVVITHFANIHFYRLGLVDGCEAEVYTEFVFDYHLEQGEVLPDATKQMLRESSAKVCTKVLK